MVLQRPPTSYTKPSYKHTTISAVVLTHLHLTHLVSIDPILYPSISSLSPFPPSTPKRPTKSTYRRHESCQRGPVDSQVRNARGLSIGGSAAASLGTCSGSGDRRRIGRKGLDWDCEVQGRMSFARPVLGAVVIWRWGGKWSWWCRVHITRRRYSNNHPKKNIIQSYIIGGVSLLFPLSLSFFHTQI
jgi:hypothetical protein